MQQLANKNKIKEFEGNIPIEIDIEKGSDILVIGKDQNWVTHGIHKYPAKYIPEFPRWAIKKFSNKGDVVIDPFSGSGTTSVEAMLNKRKNYTLDVDPLALLLTKVKTTPLNLNKLKFSAEKLINNIEKKKNPINIPQFKNRDHWFKKEVSQKLAIIKECIQKENNKDIRDFFKISFSSIIRVCSNADLGSHKPCVRKNINRRIPNPINKFKKTLNSNIEGMIDFVTNLGDNYYKSNIISKDAKDIKLKNNLVDLAVTSPPYINALDYARTHKLEYYWLGFFNDSLVDLKKKFVGTEKVYADQYNELHKTNINELNNLIKLIYEKDKKRAYIVYKYYMDMKQNLKEIYRVLKNNGRYVIFIGNNLIRDIIVENYKYLTLMAKNIGFELDNYFKSAIINHYIPFDRVEKIDKDYVLIFKK
ncbi:MAG: DNA methyltransferase [archaeon]